MLLLIVMSVHLAVAQLNMSSPIPSWAVESPFFSITKTFDTDYLLVKEENLEKAVEILSKFCKIKREEPL